MVSAPAAWSGKVSPFSQYEADRHTGPRHVGCQGSNHRSVISWRKLGLQFIDWYMGIIAVRSSTIAYCTLLVDSVQPPPRIFRRGIKNATNNSVAHRLTHGGRGPHWNRPAKNRAQHLPLASGDGYTAISGTLLPSANARP